MGAKFWPQRNITIIRIQLGARKEAMRFDEFEPLTKIVVALAALLSISTAHVAGFVFSGPTDGILFFDTKTAFWLSIQFSLAFTTALISAKLISWASIFLIVAVVSDCVRWMPNTLRRKIVLLRKQTHFLRQTLFL